MSNYQSTSTVNYVKIYTKDYTADFSSGGDTYFGSPSISYATGGDGTPYSGSGPEPIDYIQGTLYQGLTGYTSIAGYRSTSSVTYETGYVGTYIKTYNRAYNTDYRQSFAGPSYTSTSSTNYAKNYQSTSSQSYEVVYVGDYAKTYEGVNYEQAYIKLYAGVDYQSTSSVDYVSNYQSTSSLTYDKQYVANYTTTFEGDPYTSTSSQSYESNYVKDYVKAFQGPVTVNYTGAPSVVYGGPDKLESMMVEHLNLTSVLFRIRDCRLTKDWVVIRVRHL